MFNTPEGSKLFKFGAIALIALTVYLGVEALYTLVQVSDYESYPANTITVNGVGEKLAVPDVATFSFGAQMTGETVASAQEVVTERINKAIGILKTAGIDEKDIKTTGYYIDPHYTYPQCNKFSCPPQDSKLDGYTVNQTVQVKVRDTAKAGDVLGKLGGVEITNLSGLTFTIDDEEKIKAEVKLLAIEDARAKAKVLAKGLGIRLGKVVTFNDGYYPEPYYGGDMMYSKEASMGMDQSVAPQLPIGENRYVSNVSVVYEVK